MERHLLCCAPALLALSATAPVMARPVIAPQPMPAKASLIVVDTPQGFAIVPTRLDMRTRPEAAALRLGSTVLIDADLLERSIDQ